MFFSARSQAATSIVAESKSSFSIVQPEKAPASLQAAALELQRDIQKATGVKLPLQKDSEKISGPFLSLGATKQAAAASVNAQGVADEGFRILTKNGSLFIIGPDTAATIGSERDTLPNETYKLEPDVPGPQLTKNGGFSYGTANGVYTFLEDYLGVRWLMPGDLGLDVPTTTSFTVPDVDRTEVPLFIYRDLIFLQNTRAVAQWRDHQKLGFSFRLNSNHNWIETVKQEQYKEHPDWFAMINGKRPAPPMTRPGSIHYKLETTNPELIQFFADKAIEALKADPYANTFSLTPSDARGYSESPESKAFYDPPPAESDFPSVTPLILKWYQDVSSLVAKEYPQGKLAGYFYQDFKYPPVKGEFKLPENFTPTLVTSDGGYRFYREDVSKQRADLINAWEKVAPPTWFYYSFATWLRSGSGLFQPLAPANLNETFALLRKNHMKGAEIYGTRTWNQSAMINYVQAKMLWNPELNAKTLEREWLDRAYGPQAGAIMEQFYQELDGWFAQHYQKYSSESHNVRERLFENLYGVHYPRMEELLLQAKAQPMSAIQKQRFRLIEENMIVLNWRLRNADYLPKGFVSPLQRSDKEVVKLLLADHKDFDYFPTIIKGGPRISPTKIQIGEPQVETKNSPSPNAGYILLYADKEQEVHLKPRNVHPGSSFLSYTIRQDDNRVIQSGILYDGADITFKAKANSAYYFLAVPTGIDVLPKTDWELSIADSAPATAAFQKGMLHLQGSPASLYVYVPDGLPLTYAKEASGTVIRPKTSVDERNEAALELYPQAKPVQDLNDNWRFNPDPENTGLQQGFIKSDFQDASWKTVKATDWWQNQGFGNYHGTAWYRKTFVAPQLPGDQLLILFFGAVDGDAEVYFNGQKVGEHRLAKDGTGWDQPFGIDVTSALKPGQNTIAVRVVKTSNMGGIYKGVTLLQMEDPGTF